MLSVSFFCFIVHRILHTIYFLPTIGIKDYSDWCVKLSWSVSKKWYENIWKHSKDCNWSRRRLHNWLLTDYVYFKNYFKKITIDLREQQALDADPKATQQINFTRNLGQPAQTTIFLTIEEANETVLHFSNGALKVF